MNRTGFLSIFLLFLAFYPGGAQTEIRPHYDDATVVERSELIVVAHIKVGSVEYIPDETPGKGLSWVHHATLTITEVLKGQCDNEEIPIIIHFGLTPIVEGYARGKKYWTIYECLGKKVPKNNIQILDTGNSHKSFIPLIENAEKNNLWFLRRLKSIHGKESGPYNYGIHDPEDLRPIKMKEYLLLYLTDNPETAVKEYALSHPEVAEAVQNYLDHLEVQRIMKIDDPEERYNRLLPYYLKRTIWSTDFEAKNGIITCGAIAGERLKEVYDDPQYHFLRNEIVRMWWDMGFVESPIKSDRIESTGGDKPRPDETGTGSADAKH